MIAAGLEAAPPAEATLNRCSPMSAGGEAKRRGP